MKQLSEESFLAHLAASKLLKADETVLVAYSGGADSTSLLHLLKQCGVDCIAAHLHHGQRPEADEELAQCSKFADSLDFPFLSGRADVPAIARERKVGFEEAGREARQSFLAQCLFRTQATVIATGHTQTDHAETVLLHLVRGSGLTGLSGIHARRGNYVRPLLPFSRSETRSYATERNLWFHDDPANDDLGNARSRVRLSVLPELQAINPDVESAIARMAGLAQEEDSYLDAIAAHRLAATARPLNHDLQFLTEHLEFAADRTGLAELPLPILRRALRLITRALGSELNFSQADTIAQSVVKALPGSITAEGGSLVLNWNAQQLHAEVTEAVMPFRHPLQVPGDTISTEYGWMVTAFHKPYEGETSERTGLEVNLDARSVKSPLSMRSFEPGDRIQPLGFGGHRKIASLCSEAGLTDLARQRLPIICDMVGPLWIPGVCLDNRAATHSATATVLTLRFGREMDA